MNTPLHFAIRQVKPSLMALAFVASSAFADVNDAFLERGYKPDGTYDFSSLDTINLFNGNLSLSLPLGEAFPQGGGSTFGLQLAYTSNIWDFDYECSTTGPEWHPIGRPPFFFGAEECVTQAYPERNVNAGLGWSLDLGSLIPPKHPTPDRKHPSYYYRAPDGGRTAFFPELRPGVQVSGGNGLWTYFSRDAQFLKLESTLELHARTPTASDTITVHFPNGSRKKFGWLKWLRADSTDGGDYDWRVMEIADAFGNATTVRYCSPAVALPGNSPCEESQWHIVDARSRAYTVNFHPVDINPANVNIPPSAVRSVVVPAASGSGIATYDFSYTHLPLKPGCPHNLDDGQGNQASDAWALKEVLLPPNANGERESYQFKYITGGTNDPEVDARPHCSTTKGRLREVTLPTLGTYQYSYANYTLPRDRTCDNPNPPPGYQDYWSYDMPGQGGPPRSDRDLNPSVAGPGTAFNYGIRTKVQRNADGTEVGTWTYIGSRMSHWRDTAHQHPYRDARDPFDPDDPSIPNRPPEPGDPNPVPDPDPVVVGPVYMACEAPLPPRTLNMNHVGGQNPAFTAHCDLPTWTYTDVIEPVAGDLRRKTRHYFSVFNISFSQDAKAEGWRAQEYGLPINRAVVAPLDQTKDSAEHRFLSTQTFMCDMPPGPPTAQRDADGCKVTPEREHFVRYEDDGFACESSNPLIPPTSENFRPIWLDRTEYCTNGSRRLVSEVTYFCDDTADTTDGGTVPRQIYSEVQRSGYNGFGNFATTETKSNFFTVEGQDPWTRQGTTYHLTRDSAIPATWILGLYREKRVNLDPQAGGVTESVDRFDFDSTTGFLKERRSRRDPRSDGFKDFITRMTSDDQGNVATLTYLGGDAGSSATPYKKRFEWASGTLKKSVWVDPAGNDYLVVLDRDIHSTGKVLAERDAAGDGVAFGYDLRGRKISEQPLAAGAALAKSEFSYITARPDNPVTPNVNESRTASVEVKICETCDDGGPILAHSKYEFDGLGRLILEKERQPNGSSGETWAQRFTRYSNGSLPVFQSVWHAAGASGVRGTTTAYDVFGRPVLVTAADNSIAETRYWGVRQVQHLQKYEDGATGTTKTARKTTRFDHRGNLHRVVEASALADNGDYEDSTTEYFYDAGNRLRQARIRVAQDVYQYRQWNYDAAGVLLSEWHPELSACESTTDNACLIPGNGNHWGYLDYNALRVAGRRQLQPTPSANFDLVNAYDAAGRPTQIRRPNGTLLKEFFYGSANGQGATGSRSAGKLIATKRHHPDPSRQQDAVVIERFDYRGRSGVLSGHLTSTGGLGDVPRARFQSELRHDASGNLVHLAYPQCAFAGCGHVDAGGLRVNALPDRELDFTYSVGALKRIAPRIGVPYVANVDYHLNGMVSQLQYGNLTSDNFALDSSGMQRIAAITTTDVIGAPPAALSTGAYLYDDAGNIKAIGADRFRYDPAMRLTYASQHFGDQRHVQRFRYDQFGNLTALSMRSVTGGGDDPLPDWRAQLTDWRNNRLLGGTDVVGGVPVPWSWTYDAVGNATPGPGWSMLYDPFNLLGDVQHAQLGVHKRFLYSASDERVATLHVQAVDTTQGSPLRTLREDWSLRGPGTAVLRDVRMEPNAGWLWRSDYVQAGTQLVAEVRAEGSTQRTRYFHLDHLGSPRLVSNEQKQVLSQHKYRPYGGSLEAVDPTHSRMRFTGHERDDLDNNPLTRLSDLDYMHARYYTPERARFLSPDPARDGWNLYAYTHNNPINLVDPTGLTAECDGPDGCAPSESNVVSEEPFHETIEVIERALPDAPISDAVVEVATDEIFGGGCAAFMPCDGFEAAEQAGKGYEWGSKTPQDIREQIEALEKKIANAANRKGRRPHQLALKKLLEKNPAAARAKHALAVGLGRGVRVGTRFLPVVGWAGNVYDAAGLLIKIWSAHSTNQINNIVESVNGPDGGSGRSVRPYDRIMNSRNSGN